MRTSPQTSTDRTDIYEDLSKTASGMSVTCQSEQYMDRSNDVYLRDIEDDGSYVKDDGTFTTRTGETYRMVNGKQVPVRERRAFLGNDDVADGVRVIRSGGVAYVRSGNRSVSVFSTDTEHKAICRCGWSHATPRHYVTRDGGHGPLSYDEMMSTALTLMKYVGIHDAWHRNND